MPAQAEKNDIIIENSGSPANVEVIELQKKFEFNYRCNYLMLEEVGSIPINFVKAALIIKEYEVKNAYILRLFDYNYKQLQCRSQINRSPKLKYLNQIKLC